MNKLNDDVLGDKYRKVTGLNKDIFLKAKANLSKTFGFKLLATPTKHFPQKKFKGCYFVVRAVLGDSHVSMPSAAAHILLSLLLSHQQISSITNPHFRQAIQDEHCVALQGLLMVIMSIAYSSNHNSQSHKVSEAHLVQHLEKLDPGTSKSSRERTFGIGDWSAIIDLFCKQHYLYKEKENHAEGEAAAVVLSLGPRGFLEVGRHQIITFTHEAVGQTIDEALLAEIREEDENAEEDEDSV
jgi:hypothetical protein